MHKFYELKQDYLKFTGKDRTDLIQRLSTNDVNSLRTFEYVKTILTTDKGRFVDLITMYNFGEFIFASCSFNNAKNVIAHLEKYTIMDDFKAEDLSGTHRTLLFFESDAAETESNKFEIKIINGHDVLTAGNLMIYPSEAHENIIANCTKDMMRMDDEEYEELRILKGIPKLGNEMSDKTNPLECHMEKYVSFTKGCYIGQEVIARLDTYDKISRHITGIKAGSEFREGDLIYCNDKQCGYVTSVSASEDHGHIGLGFIKTIFMEEAGEVIIKNENGSSVRAKTIKLPFEN